VLETSHVTDQAVVFTDYACLWYVDVVPKGIWRSARQTCSWKAVPGVSSGTVNSVRSPAKYSASCCSVVRMWSFSPASMRASKRRWSRSFSCRALPLGARPIDRLFPMAAGIFYIGSNRASRPVGRSPPSGERDARPHEGKYHDRRVSTCSRCGTGTRFVGRSGFRNRRWSGRRVLLPPCRGSAFRDRVGVIACKRGCRSPGKIPPNLMAQRCVPGYDVATGEQISTR
jgi:hypothetical protein